MIDNIKITDSISGVFILLDDKGNIICRGHNMVVKDGRKLIYDIFKKAMKGETTTGYSFKFHFGGAKNNFATKVTTTYDDVKDNSVDINDVSFSDNEANAVSVCTATFDDDNMALKINISISGTSTAMTITEGFLTYTGTEGQETLFSRFVFDPQYITSGVAYALEYVISF